MKIGAMVAGPLLFIVALTLVFGAWFVVDQGDRAVVTAYGKIVREADPGLNWKTPWIESTYEFPVRTQKAMIQKMGIYSKDQQKGDVAISLNYHIEADKIATVYSQLRDKYVDIKILPTFQQQTNDDFGKVSAQEIITGRDTLSLAIANHLRPTLDPYGIAVESVQIEHVEFSPEFNAAINAVVQAQVAVRTKQQDLEQKKVEAETALAVATGAANAVKATADGESYRISRLAVAQSDAIRKQGEALQSNPLFVELTKANRWDGKLPTTMIPGGATPFLSLHSSSP